MTFLRKGDIMFSTSGRSNLYEELGKMNLVRIFKPLTGPKGGFHRRLADGKFVPNLPAMADEAPWVYVKPVEGARCNIYQRVFFQVLGMVPSFCRNCWKVVIKPKTLHDLFTLYEYQRMAGVPCKCGIERRPTTTSLYGGYFYTRSKEDGLERYRQVRAFADDMLSAETPVLLKRYCTEYEIGPGSLGPSNKLPEMTAEDLEYENFILSMFPNIGENLRQPDDVIANVMQQWIEYAYQYHKATGDETYKEFTGGESLYPAYVTYHNEADRKPTYFWLAERIDSNGEYMCFNGDLDQSSYATTMDPYGASFFNTEEECAEYISGKKDKEHFKPTQHGFENR